MLIKTQRFFSESVESFSFQSNPNKIPRILVAKCGLDGHDRGAKYVARALRDAGMEVIYTGIRQSVDDVACTAVQEDVDIIGLSSLSGAHKTLFPKLIDALTKQGGGDIPIFGGGVIPPGDVSWLKEKGVRAVFTPGTKMEDIVAEIQKILDEK